MEQMYIFRWYYGRTEDPLRAYSLKQALLKLSLRIHDRAPHMTKEDCKRMVFRSYKEYKLEFERYDVIKQEPKKRKADPPPETESPKYVQSFLDFTKNG